MLLMHLIGLGDAYRQIHIMAHAFALLIIYRQFFSILFGDTVHSSIRLADPSLVIWENEPCVMQAQPAAPHSLQV